MQNLLSSLEPRDAKTGLVHVVVDTTRGSGLAARKKQGEANHAQKA